MLPFISVIVPIYNVEQYLHRCIDSILSQTFADFELILINDGSPDKCGEICERYAQQDERVKVWHIENAGVNNARNKGLEIAQGTYVSFIDSDDWVEQNFLQDFVDEIVDEQTLLVQDKYREHNESSIKNYFGFENESFHLPTEFGKMILKNKFYMPGGYPWNKLYSLNIIKKHQLLFDATIKVGGDEKWNMDYIQNIQNIKYIAKANYRYIDNVSNSISNKPRTQTDELKRFLFRTNFFNFVLKNYQLNTIEKTKLINEAETFFRICILDRIYSSHFTKKERLKKLKEISQLPMEDLYFLHSPLKFRNLDYTFLKNGQVGLMDFFKILRLSFNK